MRTEIIQSAITWLDTPYHHHARLKGIGVDCAQLVAGVAYEVDLLNDEAISLIPNYPTQWHLHNREEKLLEALESFGCTQKSKEDTLPGDIICFQFGRTTSHLGIMISDTQFIHARYDIKKVVINTMNDDWVSRWTYTYEFPGVING